MYPYHGFANMMGTQQTSPSDAQSSNPSLALYQYYLQMGQAALPSFLDRPASTMNFPTNPLLGLPYLGLLHSGLTAGSLNKEQFQLPPLIPGPYGGNIFHGTQETGEDSSDSVDLKSDLHRDFTRNSADDVKPHYLGYPQATDDATSSGLLVRWADTVGEEVVWQDKSGRTKFSPVQLEHLEQAFNSNHYPSAIYRSELAQRLNVPESKIQTWFQNQRAKIRKHEQTKKRPGRPTLCQPPLTCSGVPIPQDQLEARKLREAELRQQRRLRRRCGRPVSDLDNEHDDRIESQDGFELRTQGSSNVDFLQPSNKHIIPSLSGFDIASTIQASSNINNLHSAIAKLSAVRGIEISSTPQAPSNFNIVPSAYERNYMFSPHGRFEAVPTTQSNFILQSLPLTTGGITRQNSPPSLDVTSTSSKEGEAYSRHTPPICDSTSGISSKVDSGFSERHGNTAVSSTGEQAKVDSCFSEKRRSTAVSLSDEQRGKPNTVIDLGDRIDKPSTVIVLGGANEKANSEELRVCGGDGLNFADLSAIEVVDGDRQGGIVDDDVITSEEFRRSSTPRWVGIWGAENLKSTPVRPSVRSSPYRPSPSRPTRVRTFPLRPSPAEPLNSIPSLVMPSHVITLRTKDSTPNTNYATEPAVCSQASTTVVLHTTSVPQLCNMFPTSVVSQTSNLFRASIVPVTNVTETTKRRGFNIESLLA